MGFQQGLSGLNAAGKNLEVIGNNIANSGTVGFKTSSTQFADVFAASISGGGASQVGLGTEVAASPQQFTQGNITATNNPLDMAINGNGFFQVNQAGTIGYTRNGQFQLDKSGYVVSSTGANLMGYLGDSAGAITATVGNLRVDPSDMPGKSTSSVTLAANLNANDKAIDTATYPWVDPDPSATPPVAANPLSYNSSTSLTIYDSQGISHLATLYFVKTGANTWDTHATVDGFGTPAAVTPSSTPITLTFKADGTLDTTATPASSVAIDLTAINPALGSTFGSSVTLDFNAVTQFGGQFGVNQIVQDGNGKGSLSSFGIGTDGILMGRYSNGLNKKLGQLQLASFPNPQGLQTIGNNTWVMTPQSGSAATNTPGAVGLGLIQGSSVEDSNVDLTAELVNMITAQRAYQANAQTIKTQDAIMQTIVNLR